MQEMDYRYAGEQGDAFASGLGDVDALKKGEPKHSVRFFLFKMNVVGIENLRAFHQAPLG